MATVDQKPDYATLIAEEAKILGSNPHVRLKDREVSRSDLDALVEQHPDAALAATGNLENSLDSKAKDAIALIRHDLIAVEFSHPIDTHPFQFGPGGAKQKTTRAVGPA